MPYGAHPTACRLFYDYDAKHLNMYKSIAGDDELVRAYLDEWVFGLKDHNGYLKKWAERQLAGIRATRCAGTPGLDRR